jgi:hypothetical protein
VAKINFCKKIVAQLLGPGNYTPRRVKIAKLCTFYLLRV